MQRALTKQFIFLFWAVAIATLAVGCGDEDSQGNSNGGGVSTGTSADASAGGPVTTSSLTKSQFVKQANSTCTKRRQQLSLELNSFLETYMKENPDKLAESDTFPAALVAIVYPAMREQNSEVRELGAPSGGEDRVEAFLSTTEGALDQSERDPPKSSDRFRREFKVSRDLASKYGISSCAFP